MKRETILKRTAQIAVATATLCLVAFAALAADDTLRAYYANDPQGRNLVTIVSQAPLETILTRTNQVVGEIHVNPRNAFDNPQAKFELDLSSLDTGIPARNDQLQSARWLNTAQYPKATFKLIKLTTPPDHPLSLKNGGNISTGALGELQFHGVTKQVPADLEINAIDGSDDTRLRLDGDILHVKAKFHLILGDFGIPVPEQLKLDIANDQLVTVDIFTSTGTAAPEFAPPPAPPVPQPAAAAVPDPYHDVKKLQIEDITVGTGDEATAGKQVAVNYKGMLTSGKVFDSSYDRNEPFVFKLGHGDVIKGWDKGVQGMKVGGKRRLTIPPDMGYGDAGAGGVIPGGATLVFEVELLKVE